MDYKQVYRKIISERTHCLEFGKFRGKSIAWLMDAEPDYLLWCIENEVLHLSVGLREEFEQMNPWVQL